MENGERLEGKEKQTGVDVWGRAWGGEVGRVRGWRQRAGEGNLYDRYDRYGRYLEERPTVEGGEHIDFSLEEEVEVA